MASMVASIVGSTLTSTMAFKNSESNSQISVTSKKPCLHSFLGELLFRCSSITTVGHLKGDKGKSRSFGGICHCFGALMGAPMVMDG